MAIGIYKSGSVVSFDAIVSTGEDGIVATNKVFIHVERVVAIEEASSNTIAHCPGAKTRIHCEHDYVIYVQDSLGLVLDAVYGIELED